ncbi:MAG: hypothetical protein K5989_07205, partial [Lachnospiraceae bacterium]|nr:hypothetical protein [Lachnospiraceae bacterium]
MGSISGNDDGKLSQTRRKSRTEFSASGQGGNPQEDRALQERRRLEAIRNGIMTVSTTSDISQLEGGSFDLEGDHADTEELSDEMSMGDWIIVTHDILKEYGAVGERQPEDESQIRRAADADVDQLDVQARRVAHADGDGGEDQQDVQARRVAHAGGDGGADQQDAQARRVAHADGDGGGDRQDAQARRVAHADGDGGGDQQDAQARRVAQDSRQASQVRQAHGDGAAQPAAQAGQVRQNAQDSRQARQELQVPKGTYLSEESGMQIAHLRNQGRPMPQFVEAKGPADLFKMRDELMNSRALSRLREDTAPMKELKEAFSGLIQDLERERDIDSDYLSPMMEATDLERSFQRVIRCCQNYEATHTKPSSSTGKARLAFVKKLQDACLQEKQMVLFSAMNTYYEGLQEHQEARRRAREDSEREGLGPIGRNRPRYQPFEKKITGRQLIEHGHIRTISTDGSQGSRVTREVIGDKECLRIRDDSDVIKGDSYFVPASLTDAKEAERVRAQERVGIALGEQTGHRVYKTAMVVDGEYREGYMTLGNVEGQSLQQLFNEDEQTDIEDSKHGRGRNMSFSDTALEKLFNSRFTDFLCGTGPRSDRAVLLKTEESYSGREVTDVEISGAGDRQEFSLKSPQELAQEYHFDPNGDLKDELMSPQFAENILNSNISSLVGSMGDFLSPEQTAAFEARFNWLKAAIQTTLGQDNCYQDENGVWQVRRVRMEDHEETVNGQKVMKKEAHANPPLTTAFRMREAVKKAKDYTEAHPGIPLLSDERVQQRLRDTEGKIVFPKNKKDGSPIILPGLRDIRLIANPLILTKEPFRSSENASEILRLAGEIHGLLTKKISAESIRVGGCEDDDTFREIQDTYNRLEKAVRDLKKEFPSAEEGDGAGEDAHVEKEGSEDKGESPESKSKSQDSEAAPSAEDAASSTISKSKTQDSEAAPTAGDGAGSAVTARKAPLEKDKAQALDTILEHVMGQRQYFVNGSRRLTQVIGEYRSLGKDLECSWEDALTDGKLMSASEEMVLWRDELKSLKDEVAIQEIPLEIKINQQKPDDQAEDDGGDAAGNIQDVRPKTLADAFRQLDGILARDELKQLEGFNGAAGAEQDSRRIFTAAVTTLRQWTGGGRDKSGIAGAVRDRIESDCLGVIWNLQHYLENQVASEDRSGAVKALETAAEYIRRQSLTMDLISGQVAGGDQEGLKLV